eukprot:1159561-Pelagomonas_calceolata.AAC.4
MLTVPAAVPGKTMLTVPAAEPPLLQYCFTHASSSSFVECTEHSRRFLNSLPQKLRLSGPDIAQKNKIMQMQSKWQNWPGKKRKLYQQRNRQRKSFIREAQLHESPDIKDDWNVVVAHISFCHSIARLLDALRP